MSCHHCCPDLNLGPGWYMCTTLNLFLTIFGILCILSTIVLVDTYIFQDQSGCYTQIFLMGLDKSVKLPKLVSNTYFLHFTVWMDQPLQDNLYADLYAYRSYWKPQEIVGIVCQGCLGLGNYTTSSGARPMLNALAQRV